MKGRRKVISQLGGGSKLYCKAVVGVHLHLCCYNFSFLYSCARAMLRYSYLFFCNGTGVGSSFLLSFMSRLLVLLLSCFGGRGRGFFC